MSVHHALLPPFPPPGIAPPVNTEYWTPRGFVPPNPLPVARPRTAKVERTSQASTRFVSLPSPMIRS